MYHLESIEFRETQCDEIPVGRVEKLTQDLVYRDQNHWGLGFAY